MAEWPEYTIGELFDVELGKMLSPRSAAGVQWPYLANRNVQWGRLVLDDLRTMHFTESERQKYSLDDGDVLMCEGGEIGRTAIWHGELENCYFQNAIHRLRPGSGADSRFARHFMEHAATTGKLRRLGGQTSIAHLPKERLVRWRVSFPPKDEQRRIAEMLDSLDDTISTTKRIIAKLATTHVALARVLVTPLHGRDRERVELGKVATISSGSTPSRARSDYWRDGSVPWVTTAEVDGGMIRQSREFVTMTAVQGCHLRVYEPGTILVAMYGQGRTRGRSAVLGLSATVNQACAAVQPDAQRLVSAYLFELLQARYEHLRSLAQGSQQLNLSVELIAGLPVELPLLAEQQRILSLLTPSRDRLTTEGRILSRLHALRDGIADDLLTGRVRTVPA